MLDPYNEHHPETGYVPGARPLFPHWMLVMLPWKHHEHQNYGHPG